MHTSYPVSLNYLYPLVMDNASLYNISVLFLLAVYEFERNMTQTVTKIGVITFKFPEFFTFAF